MINTMNICCNKDLMNMKIRNMHRYAGYDYSPNTYFKGFRPRTDISEDAKNLYFEFELPGVDPNSIKVVFNDDKVLSVTAEKQNLNENVKKVYVNERFFGHFERNFQLNENVNSEKITASYDNGILKVVVPKKLPEEKFIDIK
ncbi:MAG: Hsp20/alpha crystallin family protein [Candidatus Kapabacteria bacterium]|nr:Hsp20/alpha crystallin family protein [Candidatus Kapabacteria bacterium]